MRNPCALYGDVRANLRSDRLRRPGCCYLSPSFEGAGRVKARRGIVQVLPCGRGCASSRAPDRPLSSRYGEPELPVDSPGRRAPRGLSSIASDRFSVRDLAPRKVPDPPVSPPEAVLNGVRFASRSRTGTDLLEGTHAFPTLRGHAGRRPGIRKLGRLRTSLAPGTRAVSVSCERGGKSLSEVFFCSFAFPPFWRVTR